MFELQGKGDMQTYWLLEKTTDGSKVSPTHVTIPTLNISTKHDDNKATVLPPVDKNKPAQVAAKDAAPPTEKLPAINEKSQPSYVQKNDIQSTPTQKKPSAQSQPNNLIPPSQEKEVRSIPSQPREPVQKLNSSQQKEIAPTPPSQPKPERTVQRIKVNAGEKTPVNNVNGDTDMQTGVKPTPPSQPKPESMRPRVGLKPKQDPIPEEPSKHDTIQDVTKDIIKQDTTKHLKSENTEDLSSTPTLNSETDKMITNGVSNGVEVSPVTGLNGYIYIKPKSRLCTIL